MAYPSAMVKEARPPFVFDGDVVEKSVADMLNEIAERTHAKDWINRKRSRGSKS
jgi:hypothetical protein